MNPNKSRKDIADACEWALNMTPLEDGLTPFAHLLGMGIRVNTILNDDNGRLELGEDSRRYLRDQARCLIYVMGLDRRVRQALAKNIRGPFGEFQRGDKVQALRPGDPEGKSTDWVWTAAGTVIGQAKGTVIFPDR